MRIFHDKRGSSNRRRGSMYITVLITSATVTAIATAGLAVTRIQFRNTQATNDILQASLLAESALEIGLYSINAAEDWRSRYTHDTWTGLRAIGPGAILWKIVDEVDGNFATGSGGPFRMLGQGRLGDAVRTYSLQVESDKDTSNLLKNGDIEDGTLGWDCTSGCQLSVNKSLPHGGVASLQIGSRGVADAGPAQDVAAHLSNGQTYYVSIWARCSSSIITVQPRIELEDSMGGKSITTGPSASVGAAWTLVSGTITPTWAGELITATFVVQTASATDPFLIDDALLIIDGQNSSPMAVLPESVRFESN